MPTGRITRQAIDVLALEPLGYDERRITRAAVDVVALEPLGYDERRVTRVALDALALEPVDYTGRRVTRLVVDVLALDPLAPPEPTQPAITRTAIDVLALEPTALTGRRITRLAVDVLALETEQAGDPTWVRVTRAAADVLALEPVDYTGRRITRLAMEVLAIEPEAGADVGTVESFVWDKKHDAWWYDTFPEDQAPTCAAVFDADGPDDRVVAVGCSDGYLRIFDKDATTDDGATIPSRVLIGPFSLGMPASEARFDQLQVALAKDQGEARLDWYVSEDPDTDVTTLTPVRSVMAFTGLSDTYYGRVRGLYVWLMISGVYVAWAYEAGSVMAAPAGRPRTRG